MMFDNNQDMLTTLEIIELINMIETLNPMQQGELMMCLRDETLNSSTHLLSNESVETLWEKWIQMIELYLNEEMIDNSVCDELIYFMQKQGQQQLFKHIIAITRTATWEFMI